MAGVRRTGLGASLKLSELPTMLVEKIEPEGEILRVFGRFDRLEGVRNGGCFRVNRGDYIWANLVVLDRSACSVLATNERDRDLVRLGVGQRYVWFDDYWQAPFVEAIADEAVVWRKFVFEPSDGRYFRQGEVIGWQEIGGPLPEGAIDLGVKSGAWDHEHCDLCQGHIDLDHPVAYTNDAGYFLCSPCYEKYGKHHDVSFQLGA